MEYWDWASSSYNPNDQFPLPRVPHVWETRHGLCLVAWAISLGTVPKQRAELMVAAPLAPENCAGLMGR